MRYTAGAVDWHIYHHVVLPSASLHRKLDAILTLLHEQGVAVMADLASLKTQVEATTSVEQSAVTLINGLAAQLASVKTDPVKIQELIDQLNTESAALASAVAANTAAE